MRFHLSQLHAGAVKKIVLGGFFSCMIACAHNYDPHPFTVSDGLSGPPGQDRRTEQYIKEAFKMAPPEIFQEFTCDTKTGQGKCGDKVSLTLGFTVATYAKDVEWHTLKKGHGRGHFLLKIRNRNNDAYQPWNIPANDSAYLWMGETEGGNPTVGLYHINRDYTVGSQLVGALKVSICFKPANDMSEVHFNYGCATGLTNAKAQSANLASAAPMDMPNAFFAISSRSGLWVSCSSGCCEVQLGD